MSKRYPGGLITKTPVVPTISAAPGVWTLDQAVTYIKAGLWPVAGSPFWIGTLTATGFNVYPTSIAVDPSGNVYICGSSDASGVNTFELVKYNNSGVIQWQRRLTNGVDYAFANSAAVDSSGNVYVGGRTGSAGSSDLQIVKYDTSGTVQWQRSLTGVDSELANSVAVDSSSNVYICGYVVLSGFTYILISKYNTSGTLQWQRRLGSGYEQGQGVAVDSSGNVYVCGQSYNTTLSIYDSFVVAKYNTSGTLQWQRKLAGNTTYSSSAAVDSSGNVYVCGYSDIGGTYDMLIVKYDTSGTLQWQRKLGSASTETASSVAVDSLGNVYVCGTGGSNIQIVKYNTSGTLQWQMQLGGSASASGSGIAVDSYNNIYVVGGSFSAFFFAKLPGNGSGAGTYILGGVPYTYAASTLTDASSSLTASTPTFTSAATTLTDAATSLTSSTSTLTSAVTTL